LLVDEFTHAETFESLRIRGRRGKKRQRRKHRNE
jgi:hypothetical protein